VKCVVLQVVPVKMVDKQFFNIFPVEFEVLTAMVIKRIIFWNVTPCSPLKVNRYFAAKIKKKGETIPVTGVGGP
jgi:hypothetical protein